MITKNLIKCLLLFITVYSYSLEVKSQCKPIYKGSFEEMNTAITNDNKGDILVAGEFSSLNILDYNINPPKRALWIAKIDKSTGNPIWLKTSSQENIMEYGSNYYLRTDAENNIYLGISFKDSLVIDDLKLHSENFCFAIIKMNPYGDILWSKKSSSTAEIGPHINDFEIKANGDIVLLVSYYLSMEFNGLQFSYAGNRSRYALIAMDSEGNNLYNAVGKTYTGDYKQEEAGISIDNDNGIVLYSQVPSGSNAVGYFADLNIPYEENSRYYIVRIDEDYNIDYYKNIEIKDARVNDIKCNSQNDIYLNLFFYSSGYEIYGQNYDNEIGVILKLNSLAEYSELIKIKGSESYSSYGTEAIAIDKYDNLYFMADFYKDTYVSYQDASTSSNNVIIKIDKDNQVKWLRNAEANSFRIVSPVWNNASNISFSGEDINYPGISYSGLSWGNDSIYYGLYYFVLLRLNQEGEKTAFSYTCDNNTSVYTQQAQKGLLVYPNPSLDIFHVKLPAEASGKTIQVLDLSGRVVLHQPLHNQKNIELDLSGYELGTYILLITGDRFKYSTLIQKQ